jgi:hypothetical protein
MTMKYLHTHFRRLRDLCAVAAASLILPALAYADHDNDRSIHWRNDNENHGRDSDDRHGDPHISAVPEASAGWVLVPFIGAVLLFSTRKLFRNRTTQ